jgi:excisionase family DNA binding protein
MVIQFIKSILGQKGGAGTTGESELGYMSVEELSKYLNLKKSIIYNMVDTGEIPHYRLARRLIRFRKPAIDRWMESHQKGTAASSAKRMSNTWS